jgi:2-dehydro-3-deoxyphosphogluconate aldolase / (4S)-4-hydroxy-2-oxoglutarate aldolase
LDTILDNMAVYGVIPVIAIDDADHAVSLARALLDGGLPFAEITFRTAAAEQAIRSIAAEVPELIVGAGSVANVATAERALAAGARFIVSAGFDAATVDWCSQHGLPITPGVATPTEIMMGLAKGLNVLKFFPAEVLGGPKALKAMAAPFPGVKFIPTGGVTLENLGEYLKLPMVHCCGGSWLATQKMIAGGKFSEITRLTYEAMALVRSVRAGNDIP